VGINLDDVAGFSALKILERYEGKNPYIKIMKNDYIKKGKVSFTNNQRNYIIKNHDKEPIYINRIVRITQYLGEELQKNHSLSFIPEKILIEYILADDDKTFHIFGKLKRNQELSEMYFIPKTQVYDDPYFEERDVDVDFDKYNEMIAPKFIFDHQKKGIKFLLGRDGCILADDMGLGKTFQAIIAALESGAEKILVVCPSSVKINWEREINVFCNDTAIVNGSRWKTAKFTIINYDILKNFHTLYDGRKKKPDFIDRRIVEEKFDLAIIDEAHYLKNYKSNRGKIMTEVCVKYDIPKVWLLTGTPIANKPKDFFNLLKLIKSPISNNFDFFAQRYCDAKKFFRTLKNGKRKQVTIADGASNLEELHLKTKNYILRRKKDEVLDMPEKNIIPVYQKLTDRGWDDYNQLWDDYLIERKAKKKRGTPDKDLVELGLLRKFIAMEAIPYTIEMVENMLEYDEKVIIFTTYTEELQALQEHFGKICVTHYGGMSQTAKQKSVDDFQSKETKKVFIGNIVSAGVGITLTEATNVVFNSFSWVPGELDQAEDRAWRLGQRNNVSVYYQLFEDTVTTRMWETIQNKRDVIDTIMGDTMDEAEIVNRFMDKFNDEN
jgi:SNF2 family DNA or RNA helicase